MADMTLKKNKGKYDYVERMLALGPIASHSAIVYRRHNDKCTVTLTLYKGIYILHLQFVKPVRVIIVYSCYFPSQKYA